MRHCGLPERGCVGMALARGAQGQSLSACQQHTHNTNSTMYHATVNDALTVLMPLSLFAVGLLPRRHLQWSQGAFAAPVHSASMVFTHVVGVQTLLAWNYDLMQVGLFPINLRRSGGPAQTCSGGGTGGIRCAQARTPVPSSAQTHLFPFSSTS